MSSPVRPLGVAIISILHVVQGILLLLGGFALLAVGLRMPRVFFRMPDWLGGIVSAIGVLLLIFALFAFLLAWGLWAGKGWAWMISLALAILRIVFSLISLAFRAFGAIVALMIDLVIVYYLLRPNVKAFFGEARISPAPAMPQTSATPSAQAAGAKYCPNCGASVNPNEQYCSHCSARV